MADYKQLYEMLQQAINLELEHIHKISYDSYSERVYKLETITNIYKRFDMLQGGLLNG